METNATSSIQRCVVAAAATALCAGLGCNGQIDVSGRTGGAAATSSATGSNGSTSGSGTAAASSSGTGTGGSGTGVATSSGSSSGTTAGSSTGTTGLPPLVDGGYVFCSLAPDSGLFPDAGPPNWICQPGTYFCDLEHPGQCQQCRSDSDCQNAALATYDPRRPHCDTFAFLPGYQGFCEQCLVDADCVALDAGDVCDRTPASRPGVVDSDVVDVGYDSCTPDAGTCLPDSCESAQSCDWDSGACSGAYYTGRAPCHTDFDCAASTVPGLFCSADAGCVECRDESDCLRAGRVHDGLSTCCVDASSCGGVSGTVSRGAPPTATAALMNSGAAVCSTRGVTAAAHPTRIAQTPASPSALAASAAERSLAAPTRIVPRASRATPPEPVMRGVTMAGNAWPPSPTATSPTSPATTERESTVQTPERSGATNVGTGATALWAWPASQT